MQFWHLTTHSIYRLNTLRAQSSRLSLLLIQATNFDVQSFPYLVPTSYKFVGYPSSLRFENWKKILDLFMCVCCLHMCLCTMCVPVTLRDQKKMSDRSSRIRVMDDWELLCSFWEPNWVLCKGKSALNHWASFVLKTYWNDLWNSGKWCIYSDVILSTNQG